MEDCGVSSAEWRVHLVGVDRGNVLFRRFCGVHSGKMAQDVGMVESIVVSFPSSLVGF